MHSPGDNFPMSFTRYGRQQPVGDIPIDVKRRDERHQLFGAFRGVITSVHDKIPLELCSVL